MRTVSFATIQAQVFALANTDLATATAADEAKIAAFIQRRGREAYQFYWWAETMLAELRTVETSGTNEERVFVPLDQAGDPTPTPIGLVRSCTLDDPLSAPNPRKVRWVLSGDAIYLPSYGYTDVWVWFQRVPPPDFTVSDVIPAILRDAIAHSAYSDFLRPSAKTSEVPLEQTAGYGFLVDEARKQQAMERQAGKWVQN